MRDLVFAMRTAPRATSYLRGTVADLIAQGADPAAIQVFPTSPEDVASVEADMAGLGVTVRPTDRRRTPNENGIALVSALDTVEARWLVMLEDDLRFCADVGGSMARWLTDHARDEVQVYRFGAFGSPERSGPTWEAYPLREQRGAQAIALRAEDAMVFAGWARAHRRDWRPAGAPYQNHPHTGFDKMVGYWALATWPKRRVGLVSRPQMVRHIGMRSSLHSKGVSNAAQFSPSRYVGSAA